MISYPTRSEKRQVQFYSAAEKGEFSLENIVLYPGEIKKLRKDGFIIQTINPLASSKNLFVTNIYWSRAYGSSIPHIVYSYIHGVIETYPKSSVNNFAQELFIIARRACLKK